MQPLRGLLFLPRAEPCPYPPGDTEGQSHGSAKTPDILYLAPIVHMPAATPPAMGKFRAWAVLRKAIQQETFDNACPCPVCQYSGCGPRRRRHVHDLVGLQSRHTIPIDLCGAAAERDPRIERARAGA